MARRKSPIWNDIPFLRILPPFALGLIYSIHIRSEVWVILPLTVGCLCLQGGFIFLNSFWSWKLKVLRGLLIQVLLLLLVPLISLTDNFKQNAPNGSDQSGERIFRYLLLEPATEKINYLKTTAEVHEIIDGKFHVLGKSVLYIPRSWHTDSIDYGSVIISRTPPQKVSAAINPGSFDYRQYLGNQGIYFQTFLKKENSFLISGFKGSWFFLMIYRMRDSLLEILKKNIPDPVACGLAEALLTGYRNDVDQDLLQVYVSTGVVHVIAISGLHLGLIYLILGKISGVLLRGQGRRFLQPFLVIAALWIFTFISGASPSVVRSAVMFTLFSAGNIGGRKSAALNTLLASAFILLAFHPVWIKDVGFQLSYSAVAGILLLHKKLSLIYPFTNPLAIRLWESICLTLAAQIFTTPLLLFYFHRFPLLFLFSNLVAVPLSSIILIGELVLCLFSFSDSVASKTGNCIEWLIMKMNDYIFLMDRVPHTNIEQVFLSLVQTVGLYLLLAVLLCLKAKNKKRILVISVVIIICMKSDQLYRCHRTQKQFAGLILNTPKQIHVAVIRGAGLYVLSDSTPQKKSPSWLLPLQYVYRLEKTDWRQLPSQSTVLVNWGGLKFLHFNGYSPFKMNSGKRSVDFILLSRNSNVSLDMIAEEMHDAYLVADASNSLWKIQKWKKDAERLHLRFHSVPEQGVFLLNRNQLSLSE